MVRTLGVDHGTRRIRFCLLEESGQRFFEIDRKIRLKDPILDILGVEGFLDVEMIGLTYSMADAINKITDITRVQNRGQIEEVTGELVGLGTQLFDEILESRRRAMLIPGLHRGIECLDAGFRLLYSHMGASEKVALGYHAYQEVNKELNAENVLVTDVSSNTVTIGIKDSKFFGGLDTPIGALGMVHGPLDLEDIRSIDSGDVTANRAFYSAGILGKSGLNQKELLEGGTEGGEVALDALLMAVEMEVVGFSNIVKPDAIAVAGSLGIHKKVFPRLNERFEEISPVVKLDVHAAAVGAAEIAKGVLSGQKDFLGIGVNV